MNNNKYDLIISNPPYGRIGNNITKNIIDNIDFDDFINLLPSNNYINRCKENELWRYVDLDSMVSFNNSFKDAAVTTHLARLDHQQRDISAKEFQVSNFIDPSLKKYFFENLKRDHYALDNTHRISIDIIRKNPKRTLFIQGIRDVNHRHMPQTEDCFTNKWNKYKDASNCYNNLASTISLQGIDFNTEEENINFTDFIYSNPKFINKLFKATNADGSIKLGLIYPKVDWTKSWTPEEILRDYGYTDEEIVEALA